MITTPINTQKETITALKKARALLARPYGWTKGTFHTWKHNKRIGGYVDAFCAVGALRKVDGPGENGALFALIQVIQGKTSDDIITFNDAELTTKAQVLGAFDRAIMYAKENNGN